VTTFFEASLLPDQSKRALCLELLAEFGANISRINDKKAEITHGCLVSPDMHSDQKANPTASLNYEKLVYKCLGCGASGGLLWFIGTCRGSTSQDARTWLEQTAGLGTSVMELDAMLRFLDNMYAKRSSAPIPSYSDRALDPWRFDHPYMSDPLTADPPGRGVPVETLHQFQVGWDPQADRIVFPHFWRGKLVGWQTRKMPRDWRSSEWVPLPPRADGEERMDVHSGAPRSPKYHSSPDFPKDATIFNYQPKERSAVVVESMPSVLRHEHAVHMEATFGASVTELQMSRLVKHEELILWMDSDRAGWVAVEGVPEEPRTKKSPGKEAKIGMGEYLSRYCQVRVVDSPWSQDAGDLPTEEVLRLVAQAVPWGIWKRPGTLWCYECKQQAHTGPCRT
jgi:hypothetical protein